MTLPTDKQSRKETPIASGVLDYFPDALAAVARVSYRGNQQHNPGQPLHWARGKSDDHADCLIRHFVERGTADDDGMPHSAKVAWRALALLQLEMEGAAPSEDAPVRLADLKAEAPTKEEFEQEYMLDLCDEVQLCGTPLKVYVAGPMRGHPVWNFASFDEARDLLISRGWDAISPADLDREVWGGCPITDLELRARVEREVAAWGKAEKIECMQRDLGAVAQCDAIALMPGWEASAGACLELMYAMWLSLSVIDAETGGPYIRPIDWGAIMNRIMEYLADGED